MMRILRKTFIVRPPADRPELLPHFEALAAVDGWRLLFMAEDEKTGESAIVRFELSPAEAQAA